MRVCLLQYNVRSEGWFDVFKKRQARSYQDSNLGFENSIVHQNLE